ncbi:MAG: hypothetical protein AAGH90_12030 [Pseudomonadota bacterium]
MCAKFEAAVQMVHDARADHLAACAAVTAAETEHGLDSPEAEQAIKGPQYAAVDAQIAAEEALAHTPATTAQEALQKAYLLINECLPQADIKAVKEDIARFVDDPSQTADAGSTKATQEALRDIAAIVRGFDNAEGPVSSLTAMMRILNQLAASESLNPDAGNLDLSEAIHWMACQGMDALRELDSMGNQIRRLAAQP